MTRKGPIRLLPSELQNQIAAGEVVERPSSVLKELIENALDADATRISICIKDGGQSLIRIYDNGHGIPEDQLELAVTRHATSKISTIHDLHDIRSFGFRGEAIPSIASVSRFRLASAPQEDDGAILELLHGRVVRKTKTAMSRGTEIEVSDLFSNIPARLKFLKQPATEARKCADVVMRMALAHLNVDFELEIGDRVLYRFLSGQGLFQRLMAVWPEIVVETATAIDFTDGTVTLSGLAGDPHHAQAKADRIYMYVNQRPVQDKIIARAIRDAYKGRILGKEYPQAVVFLKIPPGDVDVNVHPAKTEVRFQDEGHIYRTVRRAILNSIERPEMPSAFHLPRRESPQIHSPLPVSPHTPPSSSPATLLREEAAPYTSSWTQKFASNHAAQALFDIEHQGLQFEPASSTTHVDTDQRPQQKFQYYGQFALTYLIIGTNDTFILVDQHAAHEKILFHAIRTQGRKGDRHPLLIAIELPLHHSQVSHLQEIWQDILDLGFSLEIKSPARLLVNAIPALLTPGTAKEFLEDILANKARSIEDLWAIMACKSAIKAGDSLTPDEAMALVDSWQQLPDKDHCPHGRPISIRWGLNDLEKIFKRRS